MSIKAALVGVIAAGALGTLATPVMAADGLTSVTNPTVYPNSDNQDWSLGWEFQTTGETLTALGYNDDGFSSSHSVGIYTDGGVLLDSVSVTGASTLENGYRFTGLGAPLALAAGDYFITGTTLGLNDGWTYQADSFTTNAQTTYLGSFFTPGNGGQLEFPDTPASTRQYLEVNFQAVGGVPEPATWAMMLLGVGLIGGGLRVARRRESLALT